MVAIDIQKPSVALSRVADSETHGEDSPYFAGWKAYDENPYDELLNPTGVIQMGLAENQVSFEKGEKLTQNLLLSFPLFSEEEVCYDMLLSCHFNFLRNCKMFSTFCVFKN